MKKGHAQTRRTEEVRISMRKKRRIEEPAETERTDEVAIPMKEESARHYNSMFRKIAKKWDSHTLRFLNSSMVQSNRQEHF